MSGRNDEIPNVNNEPEIPVKIDEGELKKTVKEPKTPKKEKGFLSF